MSFKPTSIAAGCCLALLSTANHAALIDWSNGAGGTFSDGANWTGGVPPAGGDVAVFDLAGTYTVDFSAGAANQKALIRNSDVTFDLNGQTYSLTSTNFPSGGLSTPQASLTVGDLIGDIGSLSITDGTLNSYHTVVGSVAGSQGTLNIGPGASHTAIGGALYAGLYGNGTINITGGGTASNSNYGILGLYDGSVGTGSIDGVGSSWNAGSFALGYYLGSMGSLTIDHQGSLSMTNQLDVGRLGNGVLTVYEGTVSNSVGSIAGASGTTGAVTIDGAGSEWNNSNNLYVGSGGQGSLTISNGGSVTSTFNYIGNGSTAVGSVTVQNATSEWTSTGDLFVGAAGQGSLLISDGGAVSNRIGYIGYGSVSSGSVIVEDAGSQWTNTDHVRVGYLGQGSLLVSGGGGVTSTGGYVGTSNTLDQSVATITGPGSSWASSSFLNVTYGELHILDGGSVSAQTIAAITNPFGEVFIDGGGSSWTVGDYFENYGQLSITNGGSLTAQDFLRIRTVNSGTTVDGAGSSINSPNLIDLYDNALLNVQNGGAANSTDFWIRLGSTAAVGGGDASLNASDTMYVGGYNNAAQGPGTLNVNVGGHANADRVKIWGGGTVNLNGGRLSLDTLEFAGGVFNFNGGELNFMNDFVLGAAGPLGSNYTLGNQQHLSVDGLATIDPASVLTLDGGEFSAGMLAQNGTFAFNSGTFNLTASDLAVGGGGLFGQDLQLGANQEINVTQNTHVDGSGVLTLNNGRFSSGMIVNDGDIVLNGNSSRLGGMLVNNSLLEGNGRVDAQTTNNAGAQIRVGSGESMRFTAVGNTNAGRIEAIGGEVEFDQNLVNQAGTGTIMARNASLRFNGGLDNQGGMGISFGTTDIFGDVDNTGTVVVSGGSNATFYDDYHNDGVTQTSTGSNAVFFGSVGGSGSFLGSGSLFFEGDLAPGNSPSLVDMGANDVILGFGSSTIMEILGTTRGSQYDAIDTTGNVFLGGVLEILLYDETDPSITYDPASGDYFDLFMAESITGDFHTKMFPGLANGLLWNLAILGDAINGFDVLRLSVSGTVVPEVPVPAAVWLFGTALLGLFGFSKRKTAAHRQAAA